MFEKELMICALLKQRNLLADLILQLERKEIIDASACHLHEKMTRRIELNLRKLRELRKTYFSNLQSDLLQSSLMSTMSTKQPTKQ